jgi:hypothetical protein
MPETRDWKEMQSLSIRLLKEQTGEELAAWNARIRGADLPDEAGLRKWLSERGISGYAQSLLVMEQFGYPDFFLSTAGELIDAQYADRPLLRPIFDKIIEDATGLGEIVIQARKTYVSLMTPRRTFARVQPTTKQRVDLGLRLDNFASGGRLVPSKIHETMRLQISLWSIDEVDEGVKGWLEKAYDLNR